MPRLTLRAYARRRGCALSTVQNAITRGRIKVGRDGLIDPAAADRSWAARTDQTRRPPPDEGDARKRAGREPRAPAVTSNYWRAKEAREVLAARRAELELKRMTGELIPAEEFERAGAKAGRRFHDLLVNLGDRLGPSIVGMTPQEAVETLNKEAARILDEVSGALARRVEK